MNTTKEKLIAIFAEWNRRYTENPDGFEAASADGSSALASAEYLIELHEELFPDET